VLIPVLEFSRVSCPRQVALRTRWFDGSVNRMEFGLRVRQLPPRLLQESVLLNAEASDPPALFKVLIAESVALARLWT
jgi:hypothetical protein